MGTEYSCLTEALHVDFVSCILTLQRCPSLLVLLCFSVFRELLFLDRVSVLLSRERLEQTVKALPRWHTD